MPWPVGPAWRHTSTFAERVLSGMSSGSGAQTAAVTAGHRPPRRNTCRQPATGQRQQLQRPGSTGRRRANAAESTPQRRQHPVHKRLGAGRHCRRRSAAYGRWRQGPEWQQRSRWCRWVGAAERHHGGAPLAVAATPIRRPPVRGLRWGASRPSLRLRRAQTAAVTAGHRPLAPAAPADSSQKHCLLGGSCCERPGRRSHASSQRMGVLMVNISL